PPSQHLHHKGAQCRLTSECAICRAQHGHTRSPIPLMQERPKGSLNTKDASYGRQRCGQRLCCLTFLSGTGIFLRRKTKWGSFPATGPALGASRGTRSFRCTRDGGIALACTFALESVIIIL